MFSFGLSSVISKIFVASLSMCLFAGKNRTKTIVVLILKYLALLTCLILLTESQRQKP